MRFRVSLILLTVMVLCGCNTFRKPGIEDKAFLGDWLALSRNHMSISGDMVITPDKITFSKKGHVEFDIIKFDGKEYILKINKDVDDGYFMRIGPITTSEYSGKPEMEVVYYESRDKALAKRKDRYSNSSSWGVYIKE